MIRFITGLFSSGCPFCRSIDYRSVDIRNAIESSLLWLLQPYRCSLCGHHFFRFRWQSTIPDAG
jgi:transposase-like protein